MHENSHAAVFGVHNAGNCKKWSEIAAVVIGAMGSATLNKLINKISRYRFLINQWKV